MLAALPKPRLTSTELRTAVLLGFDSRILDSTFRRHARRVCGARIIMPNKSRNFGG